MFLQVIVVFDLETKEQRTLQGHTAAVSAIAVSDNKLWLATADKGGEPVWARGIRMSV